MNIVFFGSSEFAVASLKVLINAGHTLKLVVTQPDKKGGRDLKLVPTPVKIGARKFGIPVSEENRLDSDIFAKFLKSMNADFFVVVSYGNILPKKLLQIPKVSTLNIHASLLPKYRGAAPVNWAIINGDTSSGVSVLRMDELLDSGDVILQKKTAIGPDVTSEELKKEYANIGSELLADAIDLIENGKASYTRQNPDEVTYAPKLKKEDGQINWDSSGLAILNRIRGLKPWPGAFTFIKDKILKIISAEEYLCGDGDMDSPSGSIIVTDEKTGLVVRSKDGALLIKELQLEGRKRMASKLFLRGNKISRGLKLG